MAENTSIEWCDATFNPWMGCTKVSPGCDHCYAAVSTPARAMKIGWGAGEERRRTSDDTWDLPVRWNKQHEKFFAAHGRRRRVFCASLADVFDNAAPAAWRQDLMSLIVRTPHLDWLLLTKRIGNAKRMLSDASMHDGLLLTANDEYRPPANLWIGATIVNREEMLRDAPKLKATPAAVRFWSVEPLLGDLGEIPRDLMPDWVIVGGESGHGARPMHPEWPKALRDQCAAAGVPFLFKQWGEFLPASANEADPTIADVPDSRLFWSDGEKWDRFDGQRAGVDLVARVGKKAAGRLLDGVTHDGFPEKRYA